MIDVPGGTDFFYNAILLIIKDEFKKKIVQAF